MGKRTKLTNLCYAGMGLNGVGLLAFLFLPCMSWRMGISIKFSLFSVLTNSSYIVNVMDSEDRMFFLFVALLGAVGFALGEIMFYMQMQNQYQRKKVYCIMAIPGAVLVFAADGLLCIIASEIYVSAGTGCIFSLLCAIAALVVAIVTMNQRAEASPGQNGGSAGSPAGRSVPGPDPLQDIYKNKVRPAAGQVAAALNQKLNQGRIRGCTGMYSGYDFPMTSGEPLVIGRDASRCHMVLQGAKISRVHCKVVWESAGNIYYVTDYSSNGTYYMQGTRLPAGRAVAVKAGQQIYLGDRNAVFRLG